MIVILIVIEACLAAGAQLLLRHGALHLQKDALTFAIVIEALRNLSILSALIVHGIGFFLYVYILSKLQINVFYPIATGGTMLLVAILSVALLRETLTLAQGVGIVTIVIGIYLVFQTS